jgi:signal transduction histidine kinase
MQNLSASTLRLGPVEESGAFLSTQTAGARDRRIAWAVVLLSAAIFAASVPFAKVPLAQVPAFYPIYQSALVVGELITAVLLFGQFFILRTPALLVLASGYLFNALMAVCHALSYPGLFAASGLLGAGSQTTAWLYFLWHGGFPLFVIAYALLAQKAGQTAGTRGGALATIAASAMVVLVIVSALMALTTAGHWTLPVIMQGDRDAPAKFYAAAATWLLTLVTLPLLWRRRPHFTLDLWLMVTMWVWIFDIGLAAVFNAGRYDLGWYAGRLYGLAAGSFVLIMLLLATTRLYAQLAERTVQLGTANKELESFSYSVSHDLRSPLRAVDGFCRILTEDYEHRLDDEGRRLLGVVRDNSRRMGELIDDLLEFSRLGRRPLSTAPIDMQRLVGLVVSEIPPTGAKSPRLIVKPLPPARGDAALVKQAWANLVGNAVKFSGKSEEPVVELSGWENGTEIVYCVKDNGAGFDMRYYDKLFGVFQRLHSMEEFEGTGVGLAIVQRVVTRHGGRVWAEGKVGEGAAFYFSLPKGQMDGRL